MTQIYEWTPEILKKVRETCRNCAEERTQCMVPRTSSNHKLAVDRSVQKASKFSKKKCMKEIKLSFTDEEYLELRNTAKKKNLPNEIILQLDNYFDHSFFLSYGYAKYGCLAVRLPHLIMRQMFWAILKLHTMLIGYKQIPASPR